LLTDDAVVGVWPAGHHIRISTESPVGTTVSREAMVLDYGVVPGAEDTLGQLIRAQPARPADEGLDSQAMFASPASANWTVAQRPPHAEEQFDLIAARLDESANLASHGAARGPDLLRSDRFTFGAIRTSDAAPCGDV